MLSSEIRIKTTDGTLSSSALHILSEDLMIPTYLRML